MGESLFFYEPVDKLHLALSMAGEIIARCKSLPRGVFVLASDAPLPVNIAEITPELLSALVPHKKLPLALGICDFISMLGGEVRKDNYFLETLMEDVEGLPSFTIFARHQLAAFEELKKKGCIFSDLPENLEEGREYLLTLSRELGISLEYLLGNLEKAIRMTRLLGVRNTTINLSMLFHNFKSGFLKVEPAKGKKVHSSQLIERAKALEGKGVHVEIFKGGEFNKNMALVSPKDLDGIFLQTTEDYKTARDDFRKFADAVLAVEEERLSSPPALLLRDFLGCFRFPAGDRNIVAMPAVVRQDDPLRWRNTELGSALTNLRKKLNWLAVSTGVKTAGGLETLCKDGEIHRQIEEMRAMAGDGYSVTLVSGRGHKKSELKIADLSPEEILFDLYCLAVLEKKRFADVLDTACQILGFIRKLENHEPIVNLDELVSARLAGESYTTLLGTQGLILRNTPLVSALEKLRLLGGKAVLTITTEDGNAVPIDKTGVDEFRRAVIVMGRRFRVPRSPERILGIINDKIVPEIFKLPEKVIAPGPHDLGRIVELALAGIPPRYPLRRPWKKINLDHLVDMGHCLEPGIRNCLGCPVNSLYGLVIKTAQSMSFGEIITYEATGCFEVYSGIWPYTGKKFPSVHGVFGGVPSEMLGGLAAKSARLKHAIKTGAKIPESRILHLGWGGDGATFDIGFGNLSGLFSRLQKMVPDGPSPLFQRALYVCYDNEGYQNTGNQYSAASVPGGNTTTNPRGKNRPIGNDIRKKPIVEIIADHGVPLSARMNIYRQEHITRVVGRALEDGDRGSFIHFLQPCTTGWKFVSDSITYDLSRLSEEGGLFSPVTIEHGIPYLEIYPTPRNPGESFLKLQARFKHLLGADTVAKENMERVINYYREEWERNLKLAGFEGEVRDADRLGYLEEEHRIPRIS